MDNKRKLNDLLASRSTHIDAAKAAREAGDLEKSQAELDAAKAMNAEIDSLKDLIAEDERYADAEKGASGGDPKETDKAAERGNTLLKKGTVQYGVDELRAAIKSTTLASSSLAQPTAADGIRPGFNIISSIIDQVTVRDLSGVGSIYEAFEISDMAANGAKVSTAAGVARTATDPSFGYVKISPYEVNVTSFVDRNLSRLTPIQYEATVRAMAMRAMRRLVNSLIVNGDGQASPDMYGIKNAKDKDGSAMFQTLEASAITIDTLDELIFAYGGSEDLGGNARLYLNKADLKAIGELRGTNEKRRLFQITPDAGNPNTGVITDGGRIIPYTLSKDVAALSAQGATDYSVQTMAYGDPANYELGLFGAMTVCVDESVKAVERMNAILGDAMVGGNLIVHKGFVIVTTPAKGG